MIKILLISLSFYLILLKQAIRSENSMTQCTDPTTEQLGELMFKFEKKFDGSLNLLDVEAVQKSLRKNLIILDSYIKIETLNEQKCVKSTNSNENNKGGLCSWHNRFSYREDRYPHLLMSAVCNCRECDSITRNINDFEFSCQPLKKLYPALIRGKCSLNTYIFEWKPALEYVQIACMCMRNGTNYPVV